VFHYLPKPALAGIIIVAAFNIFEFEDIHLLWSMRAYKVITACPVSLCDDNSYLLTIMRACVCLCRRCCCWRSRLRPRSRWESSWAC
jgi:hypothetical protein